MAANDVAWADMKKEFLAWANQSVRNPEQYEHDIEVFESYCKVTSIQQIDQRYVLGFREWQLDRDLSPRTINKQVGTLSNMLNRGVAWRMLGRNPIADLKPLANDAPAKQRRSLDVSEVESIFDESPEYLKPVWRMFMTTGIRRGELANLTFDDIDFERGCVIVRAATAKNHKSREIPLDDAMMADLKRLRDEAAQRRPVAGKTRNGRLSHSHVFVTGANTPWRNPGNILRSFYAICRRAGVEGAEPHGSVDLHSLRVTFTTLALDYGANPKAVQAILGHSTLHLTMNVYAKATDRAKRNAVASLPFAKVSAPSHVLEISCTPGVHSPGPNGAISDQVEKIG
ncbi:MAG: tyrosine-type recombinase/integrase, partial [Pirellulaceae bacterium]|nr:tyrosine-type recombinase/integrase [Pirellulaceae bacterium]